MIVETDNFQEGEFAISLCKTAKKVSMLIVYLRDQCDCHFFIFPTLALCKSAPTLSVSSIIAETDNFKEGEFAISLREAVKKVSMLIVYFRDRRDCHFFIFPTLALH